MRNLENIGPPYNDIYRICVFSIHKKEAPHFERLAPTFSDVEHPNLRKTRKISSPFTYVPARCRGEPYVRPRTNNDFVPMYDGRTQGSPLHRAGT